MDNEQTEWLCHDVTTNLSAPLPPDTAVRSGRLIHAPFPSHFSPFPSPPLFFSSSLPASTLYWLAAWRSGYGVRRMNEVNPRRARLVLGWVTVFGRVYHLGM